MGADLRYVVQATEWIKYRRLSKQEATERIIRAQRGDDQAWLEVLQGVIALIRRQAWYWCANNAEDFDDYVEAGIVGFTQGLPKFDPSRGASPQSYLATWSQTFMRRERLIQDGQPLSRHPRKWSRAPVESLEALQGRDRYREPSDDATWAEEVDCRRDAEKLLRYVESTRDRDMIRLRFGIADGRPRTLTEVAKLHSLSRERVRQRISEAIALIRRRVA